MKNAARQPLAPAIRCVGLTKSFGSSTVLRDLHWIVEGGQMAGLLGVSGAGKTTLLRILAGLDPLDRGELQFVTVDDEPISNWPRIGMVFQEMALWPHLSVVEHLTYVLSRLPRAARNARAEQLLGEVQLPPELWRRRPAEISGGEAHRLALARALATDPQLLLLDEPLAGVDTPLRETLLELIRQIVSSRRLTAIYVSHSWHEIETACQSAAIVRDGQIFQSGAPADIYCNPNDESVARITGPVVELPKQLFSDGKIHHLEHALPFSCDLAAVLIRPQQIRFVGPSAVNRWQIAECRPISRGWHIQLRSQQCNLRFAIGQRPADKLDEVGIELVPLP